MQEQLPRDVFKEPTWMYSRRVLGGTPYIRRIPSRFFKFRAKERRDTDTSLLRHATSPSMGALQKHPCFWRSQKGDIHIPA
jgi:hypothetical protein